jgi:hypothetical protein
MNSVRSIKIRTLGFVLAAILIGGSALFLFATREPLPTPNRYWFIEPLIPALGASPSSSMHKVVLELPHPTVSTTRLEIPRAFISRVENSSGVQQSFIRLAVYLPDYLPHFLAEKAGHKTRGEKIKGLYLRSTDEIAITLEPSVSDFSEKNIAWIKSRLGYGGRQNEFEIYHHFRQVVPGGPKDLVLHNGYLIPTNRTDFSIRFVKNPNTGELTSYTLSYILLDRLHVRINFSGKHAGNYQAIRDSVSKLVTSFVVRQ